MAKKIMKRSLALGALMAFVITGSAMAAEYIHGDRYAEGGQVYIRTGVNQDNITESGNSVTLKGETISLTGENLARGQATIGARVDNHGLGTPILNVIASDKVEIEGEYSAVSGQSGTVNIGNSTNYVNNVVLKSTLTDPNASHPTALYSTIYAQKAYNQASDYSNVNIYGKNVSILSEAGAVGANPSVYKYGCAISGNYDGIVNVYAKDSLVIHGFIEGLNKKENDNGNGYGGMTYNIQAKDAKSEIIGGINAGGSSVINIAVGDGSLIEGPIDVTADERQNGGKVNIAFNGQGTLKSDITTIYEGEVYVSGGAVDFEGKVSTSARGVTKIDFGSGSWNMTGKSSITSATFGAGSKLIIKAADALGTAAITGTVTMDPSASLIINDYEGNKNYLVVAGTATIADSNLTYDRTQYVAVEDKSTGYNVKFKTMDQASSAEITQAQGNAITAAGGSALVAPNMVAAGIGPNAAAGSQALVSAITSSGASGSEMAQMFNDNANIGEEAGTSANAASVMNNVTGITTQRLSFTGLSTAPQGGHGKVERKYKSGAGVWAQYMHGKDKVDDMPTAGGTNSYESQYNGAVIGYDFKEVGKTHTGISFNYGEGDSHSKKSITSTRNDFDFWGVGLYHSIMNDDTNLIFDINYNKSDADVKQIIAGHEVTANPNTTSFSFGVRAEKLIQNGPVQIVPYVGARFLTIDTDDYKSSADYWYAPERQDIWLIPVGVSLRQENTYENGWKVTPKADLSYIWALGDTDSSTTVSSGAGSNPFEYTVMDNGSFLGTLGIEAAKGDWTYGLSYSYQKGEYQRSDKWFVDVRYSF